MHTAAHIGQTIVITGEVTAREDLAIAGRIDGSIRIEEGHTLTIAPGAEVIADLHASDVIVGGHVLGSVTAERRIELSATADVEGELAAPAVAIADGATMAGRVETQRERKPALQLVS